MTIVGVAPPDFYGTISHLAMDLWMPVTMQPEVGGSPLLLDQRGVRWLAVFGRLLPGATLESARASAQASGARLAASFAADQGIGLTARVLDVGPVDRMAPLFAVMLGISGLVLLIVCSNVANLLLQRGAAREHEMAVRLALGARPARIVQQLMTESLLLAAGAVLIGGVVLNWARNALTAFVPRSPLPIVAETPIDARVLLVLAGTGVVTVLVFGLAPALKSARVAVRASLSGGSSRGGTRGGGRVRGALIAAQFALSLAVLVAAGLFLRRLDELRQVDLGFHDPEQVVLATVDFELARVPPDGTRRVLVERILEQISALPGVRAAAAASFVPLGFLGYYTLETQVDGHVPRPGESTTFLTNVVSAGYFDLMRIPITRGRPIEASDRRGTQAVAVVNQAFARRFWGASEPIGRHMLIHEVDVTVVGVAADGKYSFLDPLDAPSPPFMYHPVRAVGTLRGRPARAHRRRCDGARPVDRAGRDRRGRAAERDEPGDARGLHGRAVPADSPGDPGIVGARRRRAGARLDRTLCRHRLCRHAAAAGDRDPDGPRRDAGADRRAFPRARGALRRRGRHRRRGAHGRDGLRPRGEAPRHPSPRAARPGRAVRGRRVRARGGGGPGGDHPGGPSGAGKSHHGASR